MIELYLFVLVTVCFVGSFTGFLVIRQRYQRSMKAVINLTLEKGMILERLEKLELESSKEVNDGFIKFLSQSRETAFQYIENVQVAIQNYANVVDVGTEDEVKLARMELFSHLPEIPEDGTENKG